MKKVAKQELERRLSKWKELYKKGMLIIAYEGYMSYEGYKSGAKMARMVSGEGATYLPCQAFRWLKEHLKMSEVLEYEHEPDFQGLWVLVKTKNGRVYTVYMRQRDLPTQEIESFLKEVLSC